MRNGPAAGWGAPLVGAGVWGREPSATEHSSVPGSLSRSRAGLKDRDVPALPFVHFGTCRGHWGLW